MNQQPVPLELNDLQDGESTDFMVKASRMVPLKRSLYFLLGGLFALVFASIFFINVVGPIFRGEEVHFATNGVPTVAGPDNLSPIIVPALVIGIFILVGLVIAGYGMHLLLSEGPWYISTSKRLIMRGKKKTKSVNWDQFSGDMEITGTPENGSIILFMKTGKVVRTKTGRSMNLGSGISITGNSRDRFIPDKMYITGIPNAWQIEKIIRKRIQEHNVTSSAAAQMYDF